MQRSATTSEAAVGHTMKSWWKLLLEEQRAAKFADIGGLKASLTLPISDRLIAAVIAPRLPRSVRDLEIRAKAGNHVVVAVGLRPAWLPRSQVQLRIERQPDLPHAPVLVLRLVSHGVLAALAGPAARLFGVVPPWLRMDGDIVSLDVAELLRQYDASDVLMYLRRLEVTTREGAIVVAIDLQVS